MSVFNKQQLELTEQYQTTIFKYFILIQSNLLISAGFIFYIIKIIGQYSIDKVFNQVCLDSIVNSTQRQSCPRNTFFNWKNEISHRKISLLSNAKKIENLFRNQVTYQSSLFDNQTISAESLLNRQSPIEDIYLLLISVSLIIFFISLSVPLALIKQSKRSDKLFQPIKSGLRVRDVKSKEVDDLAGFYDQSQTKRHQNFKKNLNLHYYTWQCL